jgi:hypothetical protein
MMKLGIRTGKAGTPRETSASPGEGCDEHATLIVRERECEPGQTSQREDLAMAGAGELYRPRHAADAVQERVDPGELPVEGRRGRHQR